jgi:RNA polymerase sigma-70 factor (ECF subfamily)
MNSSAGLSLGAVARDSYRSEPTPDEVLASRSDADSFSVLYQRHLPAVYRYLAGRLRSREEAEDLTSEVFRHAWISRSGYRGRGSFRAWIFSIVRHSLASHYRAHHPAGPLEPAVAEQLLGTDASPEDQVVQDEHEREARRLLAGLNPQQQEILALRFAAELTYAEIAAVIGKREDAVKKIAYRALETLRGRNVNE